jgi:Ca2+:H+ antiporter
MSEREPLLTIGQEDKDLTFMSSLKYTLKSSKINYLLLFVPLAIIFSGASASTVFILNFIAIMPLAKLLGFGMERVV